MRAKPVPPILSMQYLARVANSYPTLTVAIGGIILQYVIQSSVLYLQGDKKEPLPVYKQDVLKYRGKLERAEAKVIEYRDALKFAEERAANVT